VALLSHYYGIWWRSWGNHGNLKSEYPFCGPRFKSEAAPEGSRGDDQLAVTSGVNLFHLGSETISHEEALCDGRVTWYVWSISSGHVMNDLAIRYPTHEGHVSLCVSYSKTVPCHLWESRHAHVPRYMRGLFLRTISQKCVSRYK
jgi:hypothetical protein